MQCQVDVDAGTDGGMARLKWIVPGAAISELILPVEWGSHVQMTGTDDSAKVGITRSGEKKVDPAHKKGKVLEAVTSKLIFTKERRHMNPRDNRRLGLYWLS